MFLSRVEFEIFQPSNVFRSSTGEMSLDGVKIQEGKRLIQGESSEG